MAAAGTNNSNNDAGTAELDAARWSVISFDRCEASGLTFAKARDRLLELEQQQVTGLCVVTDEVAARLSQNRERLDS